MAQTFQAMVVSENPDGTFTREIARRNLDQLPDGDVLIAVAYSSLNYKDALSATGNRGVTRRYPHTPGIDAAGTVAESRDPRFRPGDPVLVTGYDLGMNTPGGFGQYIRVPAEWVVPIPEPLSVKESMIYGTAGFTAALCVMKLMDHGLRAGRGEVLVTGATGGVGTMAVCFLAAAGCTVVAASGKPDAGPFLRSLGASEVIGREALADDDGKPLVKGRWAGVVDTVGGDILATALKSTRPHAAVACCGNVAGFRLNTTVFPFILRGISLLGIDSAETPMETRLAAWQRIAGPWRIGALADLAADVSLDALEPYFDRILKGRLRGRTRVRIP